MNCIDIILHLRTFVEHIVTYYYGMTKSIEYRMNKENQRTIVSFMKKPNNNVPFLVEVHQYLQPSASHYVIDEVSAPRLLSKYLPKLYETKKWFLKKYKIVIFITIGKSTKSNLQRKKVSFISKNLINLEIELGGQFYIAEGDQFHVDICNSVYNL